MQNTDFIKTNENEYSMLEFFLQRDASLQALEKRKRFTRSLCATVCAFLGGAATCLFIMIQIM